MKEEVNVIDTPLFFRRLSKTKLVDRETAAKKVFISNEFYQTDQFIPTPYYKSISKIVTLGDEGE